MGIPIEEFGDVALKSEHPPRVAGRCSVFAKSDMIHLQQVGTPVHDIVAGLCFAMIRNFKGQVIRGRDLGKPVAFQGGVAANQGIRRALLEVLELRKAT
jgi:activator of 2-hydroxyglutaryl-CoA dehydratase